MEKFRSIILSTSIIFGCCNAQEKVMNTAPATIKHPQLRVARPVSDITRTQLMYCKGLNFRVLATFKDHDGFDGVMLGHPGVQYHFEFTHCHKQEIVPNSTPEDLIVLYFPNETEWKITCSNMISAGFKEIKSFNPYWDVRGRTFQDTDGYRVVLQHAEWKIDN